MSQLQVCCLTLSQLYAFFTLSRMLSRIRIIMIQFDSFANASESLPVANEPIFAHEQPSVRGADE